MPASGVATATATATANDALADAAGAERSVVRFLTIAFQLGLFLIVLYQYKLESRAFLHLGILSFFGWSIHYFLPQRRRLAFFVFLSLTGIALVFGFQEEKLSAFGLIQAAWIIGLGLGLIAICHLPVRFAWRVGLVVIVAALLAAGRAGAITVPWSAAVWPILGAMFMFRLIVYLYQLRHEKKPATVLETLAYFFMLPNVCFPLFPVVDFQTFRRTYYDQPDRHQTYQTGIQWLFRGAIHLILYRYVYQNLVNDASEVTNRVEFLQFMLWPFLLYLRVSGTFHIITGLMHLFGFNLPETHKLYFLSSSFTDFWRRINIYWKDFIMKVFYYPLYFKFQKWGSTFALVAATLIAFFLTWTLHAYQWFWLRGTWLLTWNDGLFWLMLAVLVVANALYEVKFGRARRLIGKALSWHDTLGTALRTLGVLITILLLWSFWSAHSVREWLSVWSALGKGEPGDGMFLYLSIFLVGVGIPAVMQARGHVDRTFNFAKSAAGGVATAAVLIAVSMPQVYMPMGPVARATMASVKTSELNRRDFARLERGYYEKLLDVGGFNAELLNIYRSRPAEWAPEVAINNSRPTGTIPFRAYPPNIEFRNKGALVRINRWGMRDRDYEKAHPENTLRVALLGTSFVFGSGVENEQTFENLLEDRLNREAAGGRYAGYELLNFARGGYSPLDHLAVLENKALEFAPDYLFYIEHKDRARPTLNRIIESMMNGADHPYDYLRDVVRKAGIDPDQIDESSDKYTLVNKLLPYREEILLWIYKRIVAACQERGIPPVWIYLPRPEKASLGGPPEFETRLARQAGFIVLDLTGVYDGHELSSLWIARWDHHPNPVGTQLIAKKLYEILWDARDAIPLGLPAS